eukprot:gene637-9415_t
MTFLGIVLDTARWVFDIDPERLRKINCAARVLRSPGPTTARALATLAGLLASVALPAPEAYAFARALSHPLAALQCAGDPSEMWDVPVCAPRWVRRAVGGFVRLLPTLSGASMSARPADFVLSSDASDDALGGVVRPWAGRERWPSPHPPPAARARHINLKEVDAVRAGLQTVSAIRDRTRPGDAVRLYVRVDNTVALFSLRKGSRSAPVQRAICATLLYALRRNIRIVAVQYVPSAANVGPDTLSRLGRAEGWSVDHAWFARLCRLLVSTGIPSPTLEAMVRGSPLLPRYCSRWADPAASHWDFFSHDFAGEILW